MRRHHKDGVKNAAHRAHGRGHASFDALAAALLIADNDDFRQAVWPTTPRRPVRRIGKLIAYRPRPRRLDSRIVKRRPMMVVKRRPWGKPPEGRIFGREIIARN